MTHLRDMTDLRDMTHLRDVEIPQMSALCSSYTPFLCILHTIPLHKRVLNCAAMGVVFVVVFMAAMMLILHNLTEFYSKIAQMSALC